MAKKRGKKTVKQVASSTGTDVQVTEENVAEIEKREDQFTDPDVGGGIRDFTDATGRHYSSLEVASEYFRCGADKVSIGSDAVYAAEEYIKTGVKSGKSSLEQISQVYGNQAVVVSIDPRRVHVKSPNDVEFKTIRGIPEQNNVIDCGYYVMKYMKEIVEDVHLGFYSKWAVRTKKVPYSQRTH